MRPVFLSRPISEETKSIGSAPRQSSVAGGGFCCLGHSPGLMRANDIAPTASLARTPHLIIVWINLHKRIPIPRPPEIPPAHAWTSIIYLDSDQMQSTIGL